MNKGIIWALLLVFIKKEANQFNKNISKKWHK